jgi:segregation and condensation protein B
VPEPRTDPEPQRPATHPSPHSGDGTEPDGGTEPT